MPKMLAAGRRKLVFVPTLADHHAPKVTELNAAGALDISCLVTLADFALGSTGNDDIDDPALCSTSNSKSPGLSNYEAGMNFFRWDGADEDKAWDLFTEAGVSGFLVQRIGKDYETPFAAADEVQVYEVVTGDPQILNPDKGGYEKFKVGFYVQNKVDERAVVGA